MLLVIAVALFLLSFVSSLYFTIHPSVGYEQRRLERYIHNHQKDFDRFLADSALVRELVQKEESLEEYKELADKEYGIFLLAQPIAGEQSLFFWNNQKVVPPPANYGIADGEYFQQMPNGFYVVVKRTIVLAGTRNTVAAYAMIPVLYKFDFQNSSYLRTQFAYDDNAVKKIDISEKNTDYVIHSLSKKPLFYIEKRAYTPVRQHDRITSVLRIIAFILWLAYIHFLAVSVSRKYGATRGIVFLCFFLMAIRVMLFMAPDLFSFRQFELFNPTVYGTIDNWFNRSLGDLLLNAIFFSWLVIFAWYSSGPIKRLPYFLYGPRIQVVSAAALFFLILSSFEFANVVRSLIADSKISFNVIDFFSLDIFTVLGFVVLALLSLSYYYFTRLLFRLILPAFENRIPFLYVAIASIGLLYLTLRSGSSIVLFHLPVLVWLLIYTLVLNQQRFIINRFKVTIAGVLFWIFIFSVSLAVIILQENKEKELRIRKSIAEKYDELFDPSGERTLSIALTYLDNDFLNSNFWRFQKKMQNRLIRDSIINENITGYLRKYETKIYVFDSLNRPLHNADPLGYAELNNLFSTQSKPTKIPDLYYHETSFDQYTYITKRVVTADSVKIGSFFIISTPKKYNQDALYPELFSRVNDIDAEHSSVYAYAVYSNRLLVASSSKYPFKINLTDAEVSPLEFQRVYSNDYDELWYRANSNKIVVIAKKQDTLIESITLFSYLFCAFLVLVALLQLVSFLLKAGNDVKALSPFWQMNIRSQVHSTIIFISVLSFLIIGAATIKFFISRYERNNIDKLSRTTGIMVREMQKRVEVFPTFDNTIKAYDSVTNYNLQTLIDEVADIHNVDVNVYDLNGDLQVSSQPGVYKRGILSNKIHPEAYYHLHRMRQVQYVQEESLTSLRYLSIYAAVRDEKGGVYAYLNIPYFLSQIDVNQEISNFLVTIINLNAFIFLIAGVIALFITNRITRSFSIIGDKMKAIRLGSTNEEIVWSRKDEIGELVKQYNIMVQQLGRSAEALAKSEREGAWREMARQVAHEIKNPLTPMKLSIQYLQKAINNNQDNVKELTSNVANTLVEQIDHLSKIAADFARFANIGNRHVELFDLRQVLTGLKDLFSANLNVEINWQQLPDEIIVRADKTHMNRLFTNLLTNAIDACEDTEGCRIDISEEFRDGQILICIQDNGEGIPSELRSKIFTPNFTTKSSGTGLGLAMSKSIIEQSGGEIWFESKEGKGTAFFVQLPLATPALVFNPE
jgi:signal transduction histidine kinase